MFSRCSQRWQEGAQLPEEQGWLMKKLARQLEERAFPSPRAKAGGGAAGHGAWICLGTWVSVWSLTSPRHDSRAAGLSGPELWG